MRTATILLLAAAIMGATAPAAQAQITEPALLDSLQRTAFQYFWSEANATNGLIKDRSTPGSPASIAALGFGFSAICIGIDHGWVSRETGRSRILTALQTLWTAPQGTDTSGTIGYKGLYYHFLDMNTGMRTWTSELSTIDTALLFAGIIDARQYFNTDDAVDVQVRALADSITRRADWEFMRNGGSALRMGWKPETGFAGFGNWIGYNEAMIMYIIALGSPTFPVPASTWTTWTNSYSWQTRYGYSYVVFPPLFGHQYSHCWIDFRDIHDPYMLTKGITYFENSRRATLAQREYCIDNPLNHIGYGDSLWGLTAGDGPNGYAARGAPPAQNDNGTIAPTAAASSIVFAPEVSIPCIRNMYNSFKPQLWTVYGFRDGFNLNQAWWGPDELGIDQGPIIIMIENYLNQSVWARFMQNQQIVTGLVRAGFTTVTAVDRTPTDAAVGIALEQSVPNPFREAATIKFRIPQGEYARLLVYDLAGREVARLVDGRLAGGEHTALLESSGLSSGVYYYRLEAGDKTLSKRLVLLR